MKVVSWKPGRGFTDSCPNCGYNVLMGSTEGSCYLVFEDKENYRRWFSCCDFLESNYHRNSYYYGSSEAPFVPGELIFPLVEGGW